MNIRRWSVGLVAATLFTPALAACNPSEGGSAGASASPTAAVPDDPKQALLESTKEISKGNFRFTMAGSGMSAEGQVHEPSQSAEMRMRFGDPAGDLAMNLDFIYFKPDSWVKIQVDGKMADSMPAVKKLNTGKYQHLDQSKVKDVKDLRFDFDNVDPAGSEVLTKGITDVRRTGEGTYAGTIDVSNAAEAGSMDPDVIKALGTQATSLPFTAKLDPQGRLNELVIQFPAAGQAQAHEIRITYSDYGAASAAQKPPADQVVEAPDDVYRLFQ